MSTPALALIDELLGARRISSVETEEPREAIKGHRSSPATSGLIPERYIPAFWRNITPIDPGARCAGVGFVTDAGPIFLLLDEDNLIAVRDVIIEQIAQSQRTNSQDEKSLGRSRPDVRTPDEVLK